MPWEGRGLRNIAIFRGKKHEMTACETIIICHKMSPNNFENSMLHVNTIEEETDEVFW